MKLTNKTGKIRKDENLSNYVTFKGSEPNYERVWNFATLLEKAFFVHLAEEKFPGIMGSVTVFTDLGTHPHWDQIDETYQKQLTEILEDLIQA